MRRLGDSRTLASRISNSVSSRTAHEDPSRAPLPFRSIPSFYEPCSTLLVPIPQVNLVRLQFLCQPRTNTSLRQNPSNRTPTLNKTNTCTAAAAHTHTHTRARTNPGFHGCSQTLSAPLRASGHTVAEASGAAAAYRNRHLRKQGTKNGLSIGAYSNFERKRYALCFTITLPGYSRCDESLTAQPQVSCSGPIDMIQIVAPKRGSGEEVLGSQQHRDLAKK